ncbi:MAG: VCBS repeat-containing protein, partial [bacterium]|nr:VCBS repeat-containing protein [bacterium]
MIRLLIVSFVIIGFVIFIAKGGMSAQKDAIGFLMNDSAYTTFVNQIPATQMNRYLNFLGVGELRYATINLPSSNQNNTIYPFNIINYSTLRSAEARLNNSVDGNAWEIVYDNNNNHILRFARIASGIKFSTPSVINPGNNYMSAIVWDPNLTGNVAYGTDMHQRLYKIYKSGSQINITPVPLSDNSPFDRALTSAAVGDFNNDGKADIFSITINPDNLPYTKVKGAFVFVQGNNETFRRIRVDNNSWNQGNIKVDVKEDGMAVVAAYWKYDNQLNSYIMEKFDYNSDGKQDVVIAASNGDIYVIPNTSTANNVSFGNPIKICNTGLSTGYNNHIDGVQCIGMGDINKDTIPDIVVGNTDRADLLIFYGSKTGNNITWNNTPSVILYSQNGSNVVRNTSVVEAPEYRGPATQTRPGGGSPDPNFTGAAGTILLGDYDRNGELDIIVTTDYNNFRPSNVDMQITHTNLNTTINSPGGRIYLFLKQGNKYKPYFLGQYSVFGDEADIDNSMFVGFNGNNILDFVVTDIVVAGRQELSTLFYFEQVHFGYRNADRFIIESKDLIAKGGTSANSFNFNSNSFYIKSITLRITGSFNGIPTSIMVANRIENNNPLYTTIQIPN